jgi:CubicO group peptidase (beta-lactamase class C family)
MQGVDEGLHLGGQIYVSVAGERLCDTSFGEAAPGRPMSSDHLMLWLSSCKPAAAVAIAQLWESEALDLDDPVARHIPEFGVRGKQVITIRHLLTHTGGFRMLDPGWPQAPWDEIISRICAFRLEPRWSPGRTAGYHLTSSWFILGELVRRLSGQPFERFIREAIFEPLGMKDSWIGMPQQSFDAYADRIAPVYDTGKPDNAKHRWHTEESLTRCSPGGNGIGPSRDLGRFYEMLLARGTWAKTRLLSPQTVEALTSRHRSGLYDKTFRRVVDWGLGFAINSSHRHEEPDYGHWPVASNRAFGHSGYRSSTAFADPERQLVTVVLLNGTPEETAHHRRIRQITAAVYEDLGFD